MALNTLDSLINGKGQTFYTGYQGGTNGSLLTWRDHFYSIGYLSNLFSGSDAVAGGITFSNSTTGGVIPYTNPTGGAVKKLFSLKVASFVVNTDPHAVTIMLADRIWSTTNDSSGSTLVISSTGVQTINSTAWPARDDDASTNGKGIYIGVNFPSAPSSGTSQATMTYTNSAGTSNRTATLEQTIGSSSSTQSFTLFGLQAGDLGVRSVQSVQFSDSTFTSGNIRLIAIRPIVVFSTASNTLTGKVDPITCPLPPLIDGSALCFFTKTNTGTTSLQYNITFSEG